MGKFKDVTNGKPIREFVGLGAKCYSLLLSERTDKKVAKGVPRTAIKNRLRHQLYSECLFDSRTIFTSAECIRSDRHKLYTQRVTKLSLSPYDDKRYVLDDGVTTLVYGHYRTRKRTLADDDAGPNMKRRRYTVQ